MEELLRPLVVKRIVVTRSDRYTVRGILLTECPIEKSESGRDFEVHMNVRDPTVIKSVTVDGRRVFPVRPGQRDKFGMTSFAPNQE